MLRPFCDKINESLGLDSITGLEFNSERTQFDGPLRYASRGITVMKDVHKGILRDHHDGEVLEVMAQLVRRHQHNIEELLDLRVPCLVKRPDFREGKSIESKCITNSANDEALLPIR